MKHFIAETKRRKRKIKINSFLFTPIRMCFVCQWPTEQCHLFHVVTGSSYSFLMFLINSLVFTNNCGTQPPHAHQRKSNYLHFPKDAKIYC